MEKKKRAHGRFPVKSPPDVAVEALYDRWVKLLAQCKKQKTTHYGLNKNSKDCTSAAAKGMWSKQKSYPNNKGKKKKLTKEEKMELHNQRTKTRLELEKERAEREKMNGKSMQTIAESVARLADSVASQRTPSYYLGNMLTFIVNEMKGSGQPDMKIIRDNQDAFVATWTAMILDGKSVEEKKKGIREMVDAFEMMNF